jgi:hypothetical protein
MKKHTAASSPLQESLLQVLVKKQSLRVHAPHHLIELGEGLRVGHGPQVRGGGVVHLAPVGTPMVLGLA